MSQPPGWGTDEACPPNFLQLADVPLSFAQLNVVIPRFPPNKPKATASLRT